MRWALLVEYAGQGFLGWQMQAEGRTVQAVLQDRADRDIAAINAAMAACFDSEDYKEGRRAFLAKRKPAFQGR